MSFFKNLFGKKEEPEKLPTKGLYGLHLGCAVELSSLDFRILGEELRLSFPGETQLVEAISRTSLGAGSYMLRYYTSDDAIIQINYSGDESEQNVEDVLLFVYDKSRSIATENEWNKVISADFIGSASQDYRERNYHRAFFDESEENVPPVAMTEQVENKAGEKYTVDNFCMLYEREINDDVSELLLINAEESGENERLLSYALGVHLSPSQFNVIS
ncbi:DUF2491 family protein [Corallincola platygyrae]|uniref:DUF2491 family protein n=1 Tax=Corallincola platygyrae TaxID=1193278 RepID=A0ABW4XQY0_9GAMM